MKAAFLLTQEIYPHIAKRKGGSVIYISSIAGFQPFSVNLPKKSKKICSNSLTVDINFCQVLGPYSISKTALLGLTKVMAQELASDNIRVNCVAPGIIQTKFSQAVSQVFVLDTQRIISFLS